MMTIQNKITIVFQGDSITDAARTRLAADGQKNSDDGLGTGYPLMVAGRLRCDHPAVQWNFVNSGVGGDRSVDLYARWKVDTLNLRPDALSIMVGVNDTWSEQSRQNGVEVDRYAEIMEKLVSWTLEVLPACKIILMSPHVNRILNDPAVIPFYDEIEMRIAFVRNLAEKYSLPFIDVQAIFSQAKKMAPMESWFLDGLHPNAAGHQLLADAWIREFYKLFRL